MVLWERNDAVHKERRRDEEIELEFFLSKSEGGLDWGWDAECNKEDMLDKDEGLSHNP